MWILPSRSLSSSGADLIRQCDTCAEEVWGKVVHTQEMASEFEMNLGNWVLVKRVMWEKEENQEVIIESVDVYIKLKADIIKEVMNRIGNFCLEKHFNANNSENC